MSETGAGTAEEHPGLWETASEVETRALGAAIGATLEAGSVCLLQGEMGSGKTVFVKGLAVALGVAAEEIQSPTYTLVHRHRGERGELLHLDLYRLQGDDFENAGLDELIAGPEVAVIEWAERLPTRYREGRCFIFERLDRNRRRIREICLS
jgi:tRNA threonylcarbamoyladenosine biosynthesis protein TsaE